MKDRLWQAVYNALRPLLNDSRRCSGTKRRLAGIPVRRQSLRRSDRARKLYDPRAAQGPVDEPSESRAPAYRRAMAVDFCERGFRRRSAVLAKIKKDVRRSADFIHCRPLTRFLSSASLRKRRSRIVYVHVPKTGGTSMWASLTRAFPSHVYYPSLRAYLSNPPAPDDYDLIGLHFSPSALLPSLREDDWVIGMVRDPTQRLLSAVMHSRRETEDIETFTASAKAMREMELAQYLATDLGRLEARLQLITFGTDYRRAGRHALAIRRCCARLAPWLSGKMSSSRPPSARLHLWSWLRSDWHSGRARCVGSMPTSRRSSQLIGPSSMRLSG